MTSTSPPRSRLSREARRAQLLDAAARLVVEKGAPAVTMERLAEWAGVSKALPYSHFDNSDDVLVALHGRVTRRLGQRILDALELVGPEEDLVVLVVRTYLDAVADMGPVLGAVTRPGSLPAELADGDQRTGPRFVADLLVTHFGVSRSRARVAAPIVLSALTGGVAAWSAGAGRRREVEQLSVAVMRAVIDAPDP